MPLVSIITATFNSEHEIFDTYSSIKNQTMQDWEWIVTDDASTDQTVHILQKLSMNDDRIKINCNKVNLGAAASRNVSINNSQGEFLAFIDSDDEEEDAEPV